MRKKVLVKLKKIKQQSLKVLSVIVLAAIYSVTFKYSVYAGTGVAQVDTAITALKVIALGVVEAIGFFNVVKGIMSLSTSFQQRDTTGITDALSQLGGGFLMCFAGVVLGILGIS